MKEFEVKWKYGKTTVCIDVEQRRIRGFSNVSASVVEQVLEQINGRMAARFGKYQWTLEGYRGEYKIVARYKKGAFIESQGKTPMEAFFNCFAVRAVFGGL